MMNKILILIWFFFRPKYYLHLISLIKRKFLINYDSTIYRKKAYEWAASKAINYKEALVNLDIKGDILGLDSNTILNSKKLEEKAPVSMGGAGHIHLLFDCVRLLKPKKVLETGVAYGWSSLAILKALSYENKGKLFSVDMPYPRKNNEKYVGIVVPENLKKNWVLIREPDRPGIINAINEAGGKIDLCHYDSDKSWWGRHYAYPILWKSLKNGGLFISDDIQDNLYFSEFVKKKSLKYNVIEFNGKFIGLIRKP